MIVLDTHVWIWWLSNPKTLSQHAQAAVTTAMEDGTIFISSISTWQVALLLARDRLRLTMDVFDWIGKSEVLPFAHLIPVDNVIALRAVGLPGPFHFTEPDAAQTGLGPKRIEKGIDRRHIYVSIYLPHA